MAAERYHREHESASDRRQRIQRYEAGRRQDHELMLQMIDAFNFQLIGSQRVNGHDCWALRATPRPGYQPPDRDTKVLTGMRGTLWIDKRDFQWVKVEAQVFRPVSFILSLASVTPGTSFELEQAPVTPQLWLPYHFRQTVKATILWFHRRTIHDERYKQYKQQTD